MRRLTRFLRYIAMLLLAVIVAVAAIVTFNAVSLKSRQIAVAPLAVAPIDAQKAAERLAAAIRFRTISDANAPDQNADAFAGLHAHIAASFPAFHAAARREIVAKYSLLYTWEGSDPKAAPIALLAHQDVVPIAPGTDGDWQAPPFDGVIRDGFIWGRGAWDDKGSLFAIMEAAESLAKEGFKPKQTIYFAFGHDEEVSGLRGAKAMADLLASRGVKLDFVLDEGLLILNGVLGGLNKPAALIGVAEKGYATVTLKVSATPGHSSLPPKETAIGMMSAALARLEQRQMPSQIRGPLLEMFDTLAPEMTPFNRVVLSNLWLFKPLVLRDFAKAPNTDAAIHTTTALTIFNAGNKDNVLPGKAEATVNFRLLPGDTEASVVEHVRRTIANDRIQIEPAPGNSNPPPITGTTSFAYRALNQTIREVFPDVVVAPSLMVAATDSRNYTNVTDKIFRFFPVRAKAEDLNRFHGTNERLSIDNYADIIRFYRRLIQNTAS
ncbi:M20 family peptidase [Bradyrhizobium prioriisuperbiae]|uniref:M20 family peptidase n=1 Tax=Bradyrhizobium prioriisuperbiae TaxID=2854389 RepID=UPI0028F0AE07|nr:M20 family peptidase [Bradyrhizobium prioritasuperba]